MNFELFVLRLDLLMSNRLHVFLFRVKSGLGLGFRVRIRVKVRVRFTVWSLVRLGLSKG